MFVSLKGGALTRGVEEGAMGNRGRVAVIDRDVYEDSRRSQSDLLDNGRIRMESSIDSQPGAESIKRAAV